MGLPDIRPLRGLFSLVSFIYLTMFNSLDNSLRTLAVIIVPAVIVLVGSNAVQRATERQCASQDWPTHQHDAHVEFCKAYLPN